MSPEVSAEGFEAKEVADSQAASSLMAEKASTEEDVGNQMEAEAGPEDRPEPQ